MAFVDTEQRQQGEVEQKVGRLKLSEAIRIGARLGPQIKRRYFSPDGGSCAIGAAIKAGWTDIIADHFQQKIISRNDSGESRESIADWLESQGL